MDQLDGICRDLQHCYRCAKIDSWNNGGEICVPGEQDYNIATNKQLSNTDKQILLDCRKENKGDDCAIHTCCCETQFLNKLLTLFFNGFQFDKNNYDRKKWNYQNVCIRDERPAVLDCCGFYPNRKPFSLDNENVDCCNNHILYNPKFMKCCLSGEMVGANQSCSKNRIYSYRDFKKGKNKRRRRRR